MSDRQDTERIAFNRLMKATTELQALARGDRHDREFRVKVGTVAEAIEIWRAAEFAAQREFVLKTG